MGALRERDAELEMFLMRAMKAPLLDPEHERRLAEEAAAGAEQAFAQLVRAHIRLVLAIAREFKRHGLPLDELISEGVLGLVEATRRFDPARGARLAPYAAWWIRAYIRRYTIFNRRIVRPPSSRSGRRVLAGLRRTQRELEGNSGEKPRVEAVAAALDVSTRDVEEIESALSGRDVALVSTADGGARELAADVPSPETLCAENEESASCKRAVLRAVDALDSREQNIVRRRYLEDQRMSLAAIGRDMGISRERVRQLESGAQRKMRDALAGQMANVGS